MERKTINLERHQTTIQLFTCHWNILQKYINLVFERTNLYLVRPSTTHISNIFSTQNSYAHMFVMCGMYRSWIFPKCIYQSTETKRQLNNIWHVCTVYLYTHVGSVWFLTLDKSMWTFNVINIYFLQSIDISLK